MLGGAHLNQYKINRKKLFMTFLCSIIIIMGGIIVCILFINNVQRVIATSIFIVGGGAFYSYKIVREYDAYVNISEEGIAYHRREVNDNFAWHHIRRLERSGLPFGAFGEMMVIHTSRGKIYIDYNIENYLEAWKQVIELGKEKNPEIIIDKYLKERFLL